MVHVEDKLYFTQDMPYIKYYRCDAYNDIGQEKRPMIEDMT